MATLRKATKYYVRYAYATNRQSSWNNLNVSKLLWLNWIYVTEYGRSRRVCGAALWVESDLSGSIVYYFSNKSQIKNYWKMEYSKSENGTLFYKSLPLFITPIPGHTLTKQASFFFFNLSNWFCFHVAR